MKQQEVWGEKNGTGFLEHTFAFYKDINVAGAQGLEEEKKHPGREEKFVLVILMDPIWVRKTGKHRKGDSSVLGAFELHQRHTFN